MRESSLWAPLCDCHTPADVLVLRTTRPKWYNAKLYGELAELWLFLMKRQGGDEPPMAPLPEWPSLCPDYRQNLCFDHGMFGPGRLPHLTAFKGSGERTRVEKREKGAVQLEIAHTCTIDACVSKSPCSRCEADGRVSRQLTVHLSSSDTRFCVAHAPLHFAFGQCAIHGYCDNRVCACLLGFSVAYDCIRTGHLGSRTRLFAAKFSFVPYSNMSRYTWEYGQASSWYNRDWAPPAKQHTKISCGPLGYCSDCDDRSRQWEDSMPSDSTKDNKEVAEVVTVAEVTGITDVPLGKILWASRRHPRPVIPHWRLQRRRILNDRGWGNFTPQQSKGKSHRNNANNRAYDMNHQTIQALDTLAVSASSHLISSHLIIWFHDVVSFEQ